MNADNRSVRTMSTMLGDSNQPDEADDTSSLRSMSSTTSTNYGAARPRPTVSALSTIPDEAAASEDGDEEDTSSQSETEAAQDLPASAAAQALLEEADELMVSSQHASSSADSLPDVLMRPASEVDPKDRGSGKSTGSNVSFSGNSELSPVSEAESSGRATSTGEYDEDTLPLGEDMLQIRSTLQGQLPVLQTHESLKDEDERAHAQPTVPSVLSPTTQQDVPGSGSVVLNADSLHTPRAMSPPSTPGAPLVPKIDAGPAVAALDAPAETSLLHDSSADTEPRQALADDDTMFAGLDMM